MGKKETENPTDGASIAADLAQVSAQYQMLMADYMTRHPQTREFPDTDPFNTSDAWAALAQAWMANPMQILEAQLDLFRGLTQLWQNMAMQAMGQTAPPVIEPEQGDRRFSHEDWDENQIFSFIKQSYLLTSRWFLNAVKDTEGLDRETRIKLEFFSKQFVDALSPTNFVMTNPEVLQKTFESGGENLLRGLKNVLNDLEKGDGELKISMTDPDAFEVGQNIATTPGKVIYQNDILQLIQYEPTTEKVFKRPLLIMPPWINKFYILDLQPKNSFVKWALDKGYTVFVVSWVNPDERLAEKTFEDYMFEGPLDALDAIEAATGEKSVNVIGYCIGGTLLASTLAYMAAKGDKRFNAVTFFTAQVDFSEAGDLKVFIDDEQIESMEEEMAEKGYLDAKSMQQTFNMLRSNDLIWSFVVNNYLLGKEPVPFDLLYWNSDSTRMPRALHSFYLRKFYNENKLIEPGGITLGGVPLDLSLIENPVYLQAGREDHIAPYQSVFKAVHHFSGPTRFMLAGSGHIAGVINHPDAKKYNFSINPENPTNLDEWITGAKTTPGSWWPDWHKWLSKKSGKKVPARHPGDGKLTPIENAPGSYVKA